jgi:riboflavin kinase / FMN adenylyltransferase
LQVHHDYTAFPRLSFPVVTTGAFDGVHLGHRTIIQRLTELARQKGGQSIVLTFDPHPRLILNPENQHQIELLSTLDERIYQLDQLGVDHLVVIRFDLEFSKISSLSFIRDILVHHIGTRMLVIGYDHHFGNNREGSFQSLKVSGPAYGFEVEEIPAKDVDQVAISSTRIRTALHQGEISTANAYLGRPFEFSGRVVSGDRRGRTIGFPTANLEISGERKLIPANGVYAVKVKLNHWDILVNGMLNIGIRPTVYDQGLRTAEVHLIDCNKDLYGEMLQVFFYERIRNEQKFSGLVELQAQLEIDKQRTLALLQ